MLMRRREILAQGAEPVGWKVGFNVPAIQQKLGIDAPLAGFLTTDGLLEDGAGSRRRSGGRRESEVAVELGDDGRSIVALLPALELADPPDLDLDDRDDPRRQHLPPRRRVRPARRDRTPPERAASS